MNDPFRPWDEPVESPSFPPPGADSEHEFFRPEDTQPEGSFPSGIEQTDASQTDAGQSDSCQPAPWQSDTGPTDTGPTDTGPTDTGPTDTGPTDTGQPFAGPTSTDQVWDDEFGVLDIVEAFTAMRHEWKTQTRETRSLAEAVERAVERIDAASRQGSSSGTTADPDARARQLAELIAEIDFTVDRAVAASSHFGQARSQSPDDDLEQLQEQFSQLGWLRRWMASAWHAQVYRWLEDRADRATPTDTLLQGLELMGKRVRRLMLDAGINRQDVVGTQFDANVMNAVEAVERHDVPTGQVLEQLRPAYFWNDKLIKYADVRIAR